MSEDPTKRFPASPDDKFDRLVVMIEALRTQVSTLAETVESRLYDTRPIWQEALARLDRIETRMGSLETRMDGLETRMGGLETRIEKFETSVNNSLKDLRHLVRSQYTDLARVQEDFDERLTELEQRPA